MNLQVSQKHETVAKAQNLERSTTFCCPHLRINKNNNNNGYNS